MTDDVIHISETPPRFPGVSHGGVMYVAVPALTSWLRACALHPATTEVPRNTAKALADAIDGWRPE